MSSSPTSTREVTRVTITFADGSIQTFDVEGHFRTRANQAIHRRSIVHNEKPERRGQWTEHEVWWTA